MDLKCSFDFDALWERVDREALEQKFSHKAVVELSRLYRGWDEELQRLARRSIARWLQSENRRKRSDALALTREFSMHEATPYLKELREMLKGEKGPEALFEMRKAEEILAQLDSR